MTLHFGLLLTLLWAFLSLIQTDFSDLTRFQRVSQKNLMMIL